MIIEIPSQVNIALEILSRGGYDAYVVGGGVRDALLGKDPKDWDITTSALPEKTEELFREYRVIETGIKHGTVTVIIDSMHLEITTFRKDGEYLDSRHPVSVDFTDDITADLSRRDFTCNAIAYNPVKGLKDPFNGALDIKNKIIRCVGNPDKRFNEDALRIMRALRFSRTLGFYIDGETALSIHSNAHLLDNISRERIFSELLEMLKEADAAFLNEYRDVLFRIIPQLESEYGCLQNHERHLYDVWMHSCISVENCPHKALLRLAALLHDIGKPSCKTTDDSGTDHFYGHDSAGAEMVREIMSELKSSNKIRDYVSSLVGHHGFVPDMISKKTYKKYLAKYGEEWLRDLFLLREADIRAQNPAFAEESLESNKAGLEIVDEIVNEKPCLTVNDLAVNGKDLIESGIPPSPEMGNIFKTLLDEVLSEKLANEKEALLKRAEEIYNDRNS